MSRIWDGRWMRRIMKMRGARGTESGRPAESRIWEGSLPFRVGLNRGVWLVRCLAAWPIALKGQMHLPKSSFTAEILAVPGPFGPGTTKFSPTAGGTADCLGA
jgi:hypothetical protein